MEPTAHSSYFLKAALYFVYCCVVLGVWPSVLRHSLPNPVHRCVSSFAWSNPSSCYRSSYLLFYVAAESPQRFSTAAEDVERHLDLPYAPLNSGTRLVSSRRSSSTSPSSLSLPLSHYEKRTNWAVIVCSSNYYLNYRHVANALSFYSTVKRLGIPDRQILLLLSADIACNSRNALPGCVFNHNNHKQGDNLYVEGLQVDYRNHDVSVKTLLSVLSGRGSPHTAMSKRLLSDEHSNVFLYLTGHGAEEIFKFQDWEEVTSRDLADALEQMFTQKRYRRLWVVTETCQAATLQNQFYSPNILALGCSKLGESSYSHQQDSTLGVTVIDRFTFFALQYLSDLDVSETRSVQDFFDSFDVREILSTPEMREDLFDKSAANTYLTEFLASTGAVAVGVGKFLLESGSEQKEEKGGNGLRRRRSCEEDEQAWEEEAEDIRLDFVSRWQQQKTLLSKTRSPDMSDVFCSCADHVEGEMEEEWLSRKKRISAAMATTRGETQTRCSCLSDAVDLYSSRRTLGSHMLDSSESYYIKLYFLLAPPSPQREKERNAASSAALFRAEESMADRRYDSDRTRRKYLELEEEEMEASEMFSASPSFERKSSSSAFFSDFPVRLWDRAKTTGAVFLVGAEKLLLKALLRLSEALEDPQHPTEASGEQKPIRKNFLLHLIQQPLRRLFNFHLLLSTTSETTANGAGGVLWEGKNRPEFFISGSGKTYHPHNATEEEVVSLLPQICRRIASRERKRGQAKANYVHHNGAEDFCAKLASIEAVLCVSIGVLFALFFAFPLSSF